MERTGENDRLQETGENGEEKAKQGEENLNEMV